MKYGLLALVASMLVTLPALATQETPDRSDLVVSVMRDLDRCEETILTEENSVPAEIARPDPGALAAGL